MTKSKKSTIIFAGCIVVFVALFVALFLVAKQYKASYDAWDVTIMTLTNKLAKTTDETAKAAIQAEIDLDKGYQSQANVSYSVNAFISYLCSVLALVSLGVGLAVGDKLRLKEEEAK